MSFRTTIILAVIVALLGSLYYFRDRVQAPEEDADHPALLSIKADDVTAVYLSGAGGKPLTAEKKNDVWVITQPFKGLASTRDLQNLVSQLTQMKAERVVTEAASTELLKQYGLDKPRLIVTLHLKDSKDTPTVSFGAPAPTVTGCYTRVGDDRRILLAGASVAADITRKADEWREKAALPFEAASVDRVHFSGDGTEEVELNRVAPKKEASPDLGDTMPASEEWAMEKPRKGKADPQAVMAWLRNLAQPLNGIRYFDKIPPSDPRLKPTYTIKIWKKDERDPMTLTIGAETADGRYALRNAAGVSEVFLIPKASTASLKLDASQIADKTMFDIDVVKAARANVFQADAGEASAEKKNEQWEFTKPAARKDELGKITALLYTLKGLKYEQKVTDAKEVEKARAGLQKPTARFEILDEKGTRMALLTVGGEAAKSRRYVQGMTEDIYVADGSFAVDWKNHILAVKNAASSPSGAPSGAPSPAAASTGPAGH